jgi:hypothetical protein
MSFGHDYANSCTCNMTFSPGNRVWEHWKDCPMYGEKMDPRQEPERRIELDHRGPLAAWPSVNETKPVVQAFATGATRSDDTHKPDFEGFLSPLVLTAYAEYMQEHRTQDDGSVRASDNWQRGMPFHKYMKSLFRHFMQMWWLHRGYTPAPEKRAGKLVPVTMVSAVSGIMFNTMGYFHEFLMDHKAWEQRIISEPEDADVLRAPDVRKKAS